MYATATLILRTGAAPRTPSRSARPSVARPPKLRDHATARRLAAPPAGERLPRPRGGGTSRHAANVRLLPEHDPTVVTRAGALRRARRHRRGHAEPLDRPSRGHRPSLLPRPLAAGDRRRARHPVGTAKSRLHHARLALRESIESSDPGRDRRDTSHEHRKTASTTASLIAPVGGTNEAPGRSARGNHEPHLRHAAGRRPPVVRRDRRGCWPPPSVLGIAVVVGHAAGWPHRAARRRTVVARCTERPSPSASADAAPTPPSSATSAEPTAGRCGDGRDPPRLHAAVRRHPADHLADGHDHGRRTCHLAPSGPGEPAEPQHPSTPELGRGMDRVTERPSPRPASSTRTGSIPSSCGRDAEPPGHGLCRWTFRWAGGPDAVVVRSDSGSARRRSRPTTSRSGAKRDPRPGHAGPGPRSHGSSQTAGRMQTPVPTSPTAMW